VNLDTSLDHIDFANTATNTRCENTLLFQVIHTNTSSCCTKTKQNPLILLHSLKGKKLH
jgi:hypothetical protein